jgi:hypothetical protein
VENQTGPAPLDADLAFQIAQDRQSRRNEEIALWRAPSVELYNISEQSATELAKAVIQTGLILNGGAIVALPAICTIFKDGIEGIGGSILTGGLLFTLGMMIAWITAIVAYFAICVRQNYHGYQSYQNTMHIQAKFADTKEEYDEKIEERRRFITLANSESTKYGRYQKWGIILCFASFALFAVGAMISSWALLSKMQEPPTASLPTAKG